MREEELTVGMVMQKHVVTIPHYATVKDAAFKAKEKNVSYLVVIKEDEAVGIMTDRDIVLRVVAEGKDPEMVLVREIMSSPTIVAIPEMPINEASMSMVKNGIKKLPVVDKKGHLIGILTHTDLLTTYPGRIDFLRELIRVRTGEEIIL